MCSTNDKLAVKDEILKQSQDCITANQCVLLWCTTQVESLIFLGAAEAVRYQVELIWWMAGCVIMSDAIFLKQYLRKYSRFEVETLLLGRVWGRLMVVA